jgi:hypothetical protein
MAWAYKVHGPPVAGAVTRTTCICSRDSIIACSCKQLKEMSKEISAIAKANAYAYAYLGTRKRRSPASNQNFLSILDLGPMWQPMSHLVTYSQGHHQSDCEAGRCYLWSVIHSIDRDLHYIDIYTIVSMKSVSYPRSYRIQDRIHIND